MDFIIPICPLSTKYVRGRSQTTFANFANFSPPTYLCLHWFTFGLPPTYHYTCKRLHVTNFCSNPKLGSLELQGKLKTFVLQKCKVKLKEFPRGVIVKQKLDCKFTM